MHHTKDKGDLGNLKAQVKFAEEGYKILEAKCEHLPFDFVVYKNGEFKRVQVKYRSKKKGSISVPFRTSWADKNGNHSKLLNRSEIDIFCIYCPDTDKCYFIDLKVNNKTEMRLRLDNPKSNINKDRIHWAKDYEKIK